MSGVGDVQQIMTPEQVASYLQMNTDTIYRLIRSRKLPAAKIGRTYRISKGDLDAFLEHSGPTAREPAGPTVLIVDDDARLREYVRANLELEGYIVREAGSAEEGLQALEEEPPDLVLLDVMMPRMDGWEMLRRVQEQHGVGTIPVLMFSGKVEEEALAGADARGVSGFIGKPFDPQQLIESAKQLLPK